MLVVVHLQPDYNGGAGGVLLKKVLAIAAPQSTLIRGRLDFSTAYGHAKPFGDPPFGRYFVSIYRGKSSLGRLLAAGEFDVAED
jgi:hypothetical protein